MWPLFIIALAATLVVHQAATESCTDKRRLVCSHKTAAHQPSPLRVRHRAAHFITKAKPARITAKTQATTTRMLPPPPSSRTQIEPKSSVAATDLESTMGLGPNSESRTIQEQVVAATGVAERMTVAALAPARDEAKSPNKRDLLVAVVMARPDIKSVSDLAGQRVAMDERHLASSGDVFVAFMLAGAASVEVSARHTAAIDRLSNGEVTAAVLTLVSADAAEAFPEIAGFKIFRVPLWPPALKVRP
jgi:hypothetical protein